MQIVTITDEHFAGAHPNALHLLDATYDPINKTVTLPDGATARVGDTVWADENMRPILASKYLCSYELDEKRYTIEITATSIESAGQHLKAIAQGVVNGKIVAANRGWRFAMLRNCYGWGLSGIARWIAEDWALLPTRSFMPSRNRITYSWLCFAVMKGDRRRDGAQ